MKNDLTAEVYSKIDPVHLSRLAIVYVRQSTPQQVEFNLESKQRQYDLVHRAEDLGWSKPLIQVIDEDQGKSASQVEGRIGFSRLVGMVSMGEVGIVLGLEVSRLARNNRDWHQLLHLCCIFNTLIADGDGLYNPQTFNDRLVLGLKGTMSEAELHILRSRLRAGLENKARRGELVTSVPVGFTFNEDAEIELSPNELVQQTIQLVFSKFRIHGSILAVNGELVAEDILFPRRKDPFGRKDVDWGPARYGAVRAILKNPTYAGVYAYGKTRTRIVAREDGGMKVQRGCEQAMSDWSVLIPDHHRGYISWDEFEQNQKRIESNRRIFKKPGPVQGGRSILSGIVYCGRCGRSMRISYTGAKKNIPRFSCTNESIRTGSEKCQQFGGSKLEEKITVLLLAILEPGAVEAALLACEDFEVRRKNQIKTLDLDLERATHAEQKALRRYESVEPENRLVARQLEGKWEKALKELEEARKIRERKLAAIPLPLSDEQKIQLRGVLSHMPELWASPTTTPEDRKEITRGLIDHVEAQVGDDRRLNYAVHWTSGEITEDAVQLPRRGQNRLKTPDSDLEIIRNMTAAHHSDAEIAKQLSQFGRSTPNGLGWTKARVHSTRAEHNIRRSEGLPENVIGAREAREILGIGEIKFRKLVDSGKLKASQAYPNARWRILREDVEQLKQHLS